MNPYKEFMIESFQHEQKQILWLMSECKRAQTGDEGNLIYALETIVNALRDIKADKLSELEAFQQFHIVSQITNDVDLALSVAGIGRAKMLRFQAWNDQVYHWEQRGWIVLFDGVYELTRLGRVQLLGEQVPA